MRGAGGVFFGSSVAVSLVLGRVNVKPPVDKRYFSFLGSTLEMTIIIMAPLSQLWKFHNVGTHFQANNCPSVDVETPELPINPLHQQKKSQSDLVNSQTSQSSLERIVKELRAV